MTTPSTEKPIAAFILSLIAGVVILRGSVTVMGLSSGEPRYGGMIGGDYYGGMMGGFIVGAILGVVGGILALTWK